MSVGISNVPQLAFFPWIELARDINAGDYSLKSFVRGRLPGPDAEGQATIDAVLAPYRDLRDKPIETAVVLATRGRGLTGTTTRSRCPRMWARAGG